MKERRERNQLPIDPELEKEYTMEEALARLKILVQKNKKPQTPTPQQHVNNRI
jgi:hypothetical protein